MKKGQKNIYYLIADSYEAAENSPHLEVLRKKGIEVILLHDRVDEWLVSHLSEYDGKPFKSLAKGEFDEDVQDEKAEAKENKRIEKAQKDNEEVLKRVQEVLKDQVKEVKWSKRLADSPSCIVADENDLSMNLKRMLKDAGQEMPDVKPILELNPEHGFVAHMAKEQSEDQFKLWSQVLMDSAMLAEGAKLENPARFVKSFNQLINSLMT